ncbi:family 78 glycoside hydrolase catalytic domain [Microbacterium halophytorum]|uniref:family 78 glycoside hydrolase catalytic domain n=1 Tax=Microbacterium halophytorum TaxID=2067568 RepID=UPI000CFAC7B0|nr:family 78 glycoside hydrolase catalytic domain [Microbacterium halophytorum]
MTDLVEARTATQPSPHPSRQTAEARAADGAPRALSVALSPTPRLTWPVEPGLDVTPATIVRVHDESGDLHDEIRLPRGAAPEATVRRPLAPFSRYQWSVQPLTAGARRTTSLLDTAAFTGEDWTASWLTAPAGSTIRRRVPRIDGVRRAWLMLTAQGLVRVSIGGRVVNASHLDPSRTDTVRALYRCYDVTDLVAGEATTLDITVGTGEWTRTGEQPRVLVELVVRDDADGLVRVAPDEASPLLRSAITVDEPFYLERHEPRVDGSATGGSPGLVEDPHPSFPLPSSIGPDPAPPIRRIATRGLRELARGPGVRVFDAGTNIAGRARIALPHPLPEGTTVRLTHGEHLDRERRLDTTNLSMPQDRDRPRQVLEWVSDGRATTIEPWFAYYGFRYVEATGLPATLEVVAEADLMHSDVRAAGRIDTDSRVITELLARAERTFLNNVHGVPEDCPTREQAAWTGDAASVAEYALAAFRSETFLRKWIQDLVTSIRPSGELPSVAPDVRADKFRADPVWGAALHRLLHGHWMHYGDAELVDSALPALRRWADFQWSGRDEQGIVGEAPVSHGQDWLALEQTPAQLLHTAAVIDCLETLAALETALGTASEARRRVSQAAALRTAARAAFVDSDRGVVANGSQGSYAVALEAGVLTEAEAPLAVRRIVGDIRARGSRVSGGFATVRAIVRTLSAAGEHRTLLDVVSQPAEPGVGAMLATGPGTFWESWWIDPENVGTGSLDHVGLGGPFAGWVWEGVLGLRPTSPGYRSFDLEPVLIGGMERLAVTTPLPRGDLSIAVARAGDLMTVSTTVPGGTSGRLRLPDGRSVRLTAGAHRFECRLRSAGSDPAERAGSPPPVAAPVPWQAPPLAPVAADVDRPPFRMSAASLSPGAGEPAATDRERLDCTPVPHAQPPGPVVEVRAGTPAASPTVVLRPEQPLDLRGARFAYASLDLCLARPETTCHLLLIVRSADGSERTGTARAWPASWSRVAVDLDGWSGVDAVTEIEVGLRRVGVGPIPLALHAPATDGRDGFHLGEVGVSGLRRTW